MADYSIRRATGADLDAIMRVEDACFAPSVRETRETFAERLAAFPGGNFVLVAGAPHSDARDGGSGAPADGSRDTAVADSPVVADNIVIADNIVVADNAVVGYLCAELWAERPAPESDAWKLGHSAASAHDGRGPVLYISSLAVDPAYRGHGAGRALFRESIVRTRADCPWVRAIAFIVSEAWASARALYETEGFGYTGRIAGFFGDADALIMERGS